MSDSAGETPAAPPDPWKDYHDERCDFAWFGPPRACSCGLADLIDEQEQRAIRAEADLTAARAQIARLTEDMAWIRTKIGVPSDAQMFQGDSTIAGRLHVVVGHADGYMKYIAAYKCDDKQGEIARLSVRAEAAEASLLALQQQIEAACESAMRLNVPIPQLVARLRSAAHLTGGPA